MPPRGVRGGIKQLLEDERSRGRERTSGAREGSGAEVSEGAGLGAKGKGSGARGRGAGARGGGGVRERSAASGGVVRGAGASTEGTAASGSGGRQGIKRSREEAEEHKESLRTKDDEAFTRKLILDWGKRKISCGCPRRSRSCNETGC